VKEAAHMGGFFFRRLFFRKLMALERIDAACTSSAVVSEMRFPAV
jgi:hypothetical protein